MNEYIATATVVLGVLLFISFPLMRVSHSGHTTRLISVVQVLTYIVILATTITLGVVGGVTRDAMTSCGILTFLLTPFSVANIAFLLMRPDTKRDCVPSDFCL